MQQNIAPSPKPKVTLHFQLIENSLHDDEYDDDNDDDTFPSPVVIPYSSAVRSGVPAPRSCQLFPGIDLATQLTVKLLKAEVQGNIIYSSKPPGGNPSSGLEHRDRGMSQSTLEVSVMPLF